MKGLAPGNVGGDPQRQQEYPEQNVGVGSVQLVNPLFVTTDVGTAVLPDRRGHVLLGGYEAGAGVDVVPG